LETQGLRLDKQEYFILLRPKDSTDAKLIKKLFENIDINDSISPFVSNFERILRDGGDSELVNYLLDKGVNINGDGYNSLHAGVRSNNINLPTFQRIIDNSSDINARIDKILRTPLLHALSIKHMYNYEKIELLLQNGADIEISDYKGQNAYDYVNIKLKDDPILKKIYLDLLDKYK